MENTDTSKTQENYTEKEAAKWLKISRATLQRARYRKDISFYRMGNNRIVYARRHLDAYCRKCEQGGNNNVPIG